MNLRQLEIVKAIVDTGSFTRAGQELHVSQSAVSRQILLLEQELQESVFLRIGKRIKITPSGEAVLALAHRVFEDLKETRASITEKQRSLSGTIRLSGGMTVCLYVFPELIKEYRRIHPAMEVRVSTGSTSRLLRKLRAGSEDLGLLTLPVDGPGLVSAPVFQEELLLVTEPTHPLARRTRVQSSDLTRLPFVLFESGSNTRRVIDEFFIRERIQPRVVTETENVEILKALVRIGLGVAIVPYQSVSREVQTSQLACARIAGPPLIRQTGWVYPQLKRVPRPVQEMIDTLDRVLDRLRTTFDPGGELRPAAAAAVARPIR
jgi:DNA-binding transcriptional LysR family regulator